MLGMLLGYSFEPRPDSRVLATAGSVMIISLSKKGCSHSKNQFDKREQDLLVQKFGCCGDLKGLMLFRQPPFFFLTKDDKRRLYLRGVANY